MMTIALPLQGECVSGHFGHPECFSLVSVDPSTREILGEKRLTPPPHQPGLLPVWLSEQGANVVLAAGIGPMAVNLLQSHGIDVTTGVPPLTAFEAVRLYLDGKLETSGNTCDHGHGHGGHDCGNHG
jgi:predicted Fe-Mo cluster-binding NifX family protein